MFLIGGLRQQQSAGGHSAAATASADWLNGHLVMHTLEHVDDGMNIGHWDIPPQFPFDDVNLTPSTHPVTFSELRAAYDACTTVEQTNSVAAAV